MAYEIKRVDYYGLICHHCKKHLMYNGLMLQTRSMWGVWYYCEDCAKWKGCAFEQDFKGKLPLIDQDILKQITDKVPYFSPNVT